MSKGSLADVHRGSVQDRSGPCSSGGSREDGRRHLGEFGVAMNGRRVAKPENSSAVEADSSRGQADEEQGFARHDHTAGGAAPLSYAQQRLWILDQIDPGKPGANTPRAFRIRGWLDIEALRRALDTVRGRHEVLRSVFRSIDATLVQAVVTSAGDPLAVVDLSAHAEPVREAEVLRLAEEEAQRPFDLTRGPILRATLLRLSSEEHVLLITSHRIAFDERSGEIFDRELGVLYDAYADGRPSPLPPLPAQYREFSALQAEFLRGKGFEEELAYWKRQLHGMPPTLDLPASRRRPREATFRAATEVAELGRGLLEALRSLGEREGADLFATLLAAFQVLLLRHSGRGDFAVGSSVAGRPPEFEGSIGLFANNLVFRASVSGDPTFRDLLRRVRGVAVEAEAHQDVPFEKLVEELNPERTLSHPPLFQVMMVLQPGSRAPLRLAGLSVAPLAPTAEIARHELVLRFGSEGDRTWASLQYKTDLFEPRTIRRLLAHLEVLLRGVVENPNRRLSQLPLMAPGERQQVLEVWNQTAIEYPGVTVTGLFEDQAERTPEAVAVEFQGRSLTYRELNQRSNRLARYLRAVGVGPETLVGLALKRSLDTVVALLGVLKAGGAYMPLDPAYPAQRLGSMIGDSGAAVVLADRTAAATPPKTPARVLLLDDLSGQIAAQSAESLPARAAPHNLAYVIHTSGSTGKPKGVEIEHRALANYIQYAAELFALGEADRVLQFASLSFDVAAEEIFATLARGATLVLRSEEMIASVADFFAACRDWRVTVLDLPTAYWHELAAVAFAEGLRLPEPLRLVILGGEKALPERLAQWREVAGAGRVRLLNGYGPTEATIAATFWEAGERVPSNLATVPIGRPVANARIYLLDRSLEPVPIGVVGELYIGGVGLARGYRNRPDLTAEAFVPDPFHSNERLYRTGDRARHESEGDIEFMGRVDGQVKVRGFRIEPGEVETALRAHPSVREAFVVLRGDEPLRRLVAYFVAGPDGVPAAGDLRAHLKKTLPDFMVPSKFVELARLPLTSGGKVDRHALPDADAEASGPEREYVAPRDLMEIKLAHLWEEVLHVERVGTGDDFFELGGHSLLAVRLLSQVEKAFDRQLPLAVVFDAPTVEQMAALLREEGWSPSWSPLVPIQPRGSRPPLYCVHAVGGHVLFYRDLAHHLGPDQPVYALQARGLDGKQAPSRRVEEMAACYVKEIRKLQRMGPYSLGGYSFGGTVAFEMARQLQAAGQKVSLVALLDSDNLPRLPNTGPPAIVKDVDFLWRRLRLHGAALIHLEPKAMFTYFRAKAVTALGWARKKSGAYLEPALHPVPRAIRMVLAANKEAEDRYLPGPYEGRVVLFRASNWRTTGLADPSLGWGRVCPAGLEIIEVAGDHGGVIYEPQVGALARELAARLPGLEEGGDAAQSDMGRAWPGPGK